MANERYQTLAEFIAKPFGTGNSIDRDTRMNEMYQRMMTTHKISIVATTEIEKSFYYHLHIPSESQQKNKVDYFYDVVLRFFTEDPSISKEKTLMNYYVQFYSNSPSFIYQYAYLYNKNGFLINELYRKTDMEHINTPPTKRNPDMSLNYDKSIYVACRYLSDKKFGWLSKIGHATVKRVTKQKFFKQIGDFNSVKLDQALMSEEKKLAKELGRKTARSEERETSSNKIKSTLSTIKNKGAKSITVKSKITGKKASKTTGTRSTTRIIRAGKRT